MCTRCTHPNFRHPCDQTKVLCVTTMSPRCRPHPCSIIFITPAVRSKKMHMRSCSREIFNHALPASLSCRLVKSRVPKIARSTPSARRSPRPSWRFTRSTWTRLPSARSRTPSWRTTATSSWPTLAAASPRSSAALRPAHDTRSPTVKLSKVCIACRMGFVELSVERRCIWPTLVRSLEGLSVAASRSASTAALFCDLGFWLGK